MRNTQHILVFMAGCVINTSNTLDKDEFWEEYLIKNSSKKCSYQMHLSISSSFTWHQILPIHNRMTIPKLLDRSCFSACPKFTCVSFIFWYTPRAQHEEQAVKKQYLLNKQTAYSWISPGQIAFLSLAKKETWRDNGQRWKINPKISSDVPKQGMSVVL